MTQQHISPDAPAFLYSLPASVPFSSLRLKSAPSSMALCSRRPIGVCLGCPWRQLAIQWRRCQKRKEILSRNSIKPGEEPGSRLRRWRTHGAREPTWRWDPGLICWLLLQKSAGESHTQLDWFVEGLQSIVHGPFIAIASMCHNFGSAGMSPLISHGSRQLQFCLFRCLKTNLVTKPWQLEKMTCCLRLSS